MVRYNEEKGKKHKAVQETIHEVETKKHKVECSIEILREYADELAKKAESKHDFTLLSKSNAFRKKVCDKTEELSKLEDKLKELKEKLLL